MSAATLSPERQIAAMFGAPLPSGLPPLEEIDGKQVVRGLKVFRVGTFKDSRGRQHTYESSDLQAIVRNFELLRNEGFLVDVPVRADHSSSINNVLGYITALRTDGKFLLADIEFTEPDGAAKYSRGTFRSRSLEIGPYETNGDEPEVYFPCVLGLAFVDIPAVEGLFGRNRPTEDHPVSTQTATFRIRGVETTNVEQVQAYIDELEKAQAPAPHTFRLPTGEESDYAKVQTFIDDLVKQVDDAKVQARKDFVKKLVEDDKLAASQLEAMQSFVAGLAPDQYEAWAKAYENAPKLGIFSKNSGSGNGGDNAGAGDTMKEEIAVLEERIAMHRRAGTPEDVIQKSESYQRLQALKGSN